MQSILLRALKEWLRKIRTNYLGGYGYSIKSYSQEGEDIILKRIFGDKKDGFFVDVGAHHPKRFSNTYFFYKLGWHGINIDAMPGSMILFNTLRPRDINIEIPISSKKEILTYYAFNEPALNGFSEGLSQQRNGLRRYKIVSTQKMETSTLSNVLSEHLARGQKIDFMSIDVEGLDLEVIKSNDWDNFRPKIILVEMLNNSLEDFMSDDVCVYLKDKNYNLYAKTVNTAFFRCNDR